MVAVLERPGSVARAVQAAALEAVLDGADRVCVFRLEVALPVAFKAAGEEAVWEEDGQGGGEEDGHEDCVELVEEGSELLSIRVASGAFGLEAHQAHCDEGDG